MDHLCPCVTLVVRRFPAARTLRLPAEQDVTPGARQPRQMKRLPTSGPARGDYLVFFRCAVGEGRELCDRAHVMSAATACPGEGFGQRFRVGRLAARPVGKLTGSMPITKLPGD